MATSPFFDWPTARKALRAGLRIRRAGWTGERDGSWLERRAGGLVWVIYDDEREEHILRAEEFFAEDFYAIDWTNLPKSCVSSGAVPGGGNGCPDPFDPEDPADPDDEDVDDEEGGSGGGGGGGGGGGDDDGGSGGNGGIIIIGGGGNGNKPPKPPKPPIAAPTLTLTMKELTYDGKTCINATTVNDAVIDAKLSMSPVPADWQGPSFYNAWVNFGERTIYQHSIHPGQTLSFQWPVALADGSPQSVAMGSTLIFHATAHAEGSDNPTAVGKASIVRRCNQCDQAGYPGLQYSFPPFCEPGYVALAKHYLEDDGGWCVSPCIPCSVAPPGTGECLEWEAQQPQPGDGASSGQTAQTQAAQVQAARVSFDAAPEQLAPGPFDSYDGETVYVG